MGCSSSSLEQHEWEPQREDHPHGALARQDLMLPALVLLFTLSRSVKGNDLMRKRHHRAVKGSGRSIPFILICIFGGAPTEIAAQGPLASGSRVRVTAPECELRGQEATFRALRADTLVLETTECPLASVTRLDVSGGQKSHALLGAGIGFAAGALVGLVHCSRDAGGFSDVGMCDLADDDLTLWVAFVIGAMGGLWGGFVGTLIKGIIYKGCQGGGNTLNS